MSASTMKRRLRCGMCGTKTEFPELTQEQVTEWCKVCRFHWHHSQDIDFHHRCAICIGRFWQARLNALRILLLRPSALRSEEL
jgi:hypothetical protein